MRSALRHPRTLALGAGLLALGVTGALLHGPGRPGVDRDRGDRAALAATTAAAQHSLLRLTTDADLRSGSARGVSVGDGSLRISRPIGTLRWADRTWSRSQWTSAWVTPGHEFTELIPSWNALTPRGTWLTVQARVRTDADTPATSGWKVLGRWAAGDATLRRTSSGSQRDAVASVATDTLVAASGVRLESYQLRVVLLRGEKSTRTPVMRSIHAVASRRAASVPATSRPRLAARTLAVPSYSQMIHRGEYPQYGGGGQAWCSPTALSMILGHYGALPSARSYAWVDDRYADPWVDHAARSVFDHEYDGAGNWAFNTAYAATRTGEAFVTRLRDLTETERFIAAGIPLAASITFGRGELTGAPIRATAGHLVVIVGFTSSGDVVVNDPAASNNSSVRRTYDRAEFEKVWQRRSAGLVYVVHTPDRALPRGF